MLYGAGLPESWLGLQMRGGGLSRSLRDQAGSPVSRTWHSDTGLGHPCWDQTVRFQSVDSSMAQLPVPSAVAGVVISGATEAVIGGLSDETSSDDSRVRWKLTGGRAPDASQGSSSTSTSSTSGVNRWTYWLSCGDGESHAIATVATTADSATAWTLRVRLVRTCPGVWSHLAVNVAPPSPMMSFPHPLDDFYDALGVPLGVPPLVGMEG
eukprot:COSAG02_NODE_13344_length_1406_cov_4.790360_2_plen_210_part_00